MNNPQGALPRARQNPSLSAMDSEMEQRRRLAEELDAQGIYPPAWTTATRAPWSKQAVYRQTGFHDAARHFIANGELYERANNPALTPSAKQAAESLKAYLGQAAKPIHEIIPLDQVPLTHPVGRPMTPQSPEEAAAMAKLLAGQAVNHETWHEGDPVPPAMQKWITANGYKTSDIYQGPDGWHYQRNERTLESPEIAKLRLAEAARQPVKQATNIVTGAASDPANAKVAEKILTDWHKAGAIPPAASSAAQPIADTSAGAAPASANDNAKMAEPSPESGHQSPPLSPQSQAILTGMEEATGTKPEEGIKLAQAESGSKSESDTAAPLLPSPGADKSTTPSSSISTPSQGQTQNGKSGKAPDPVPEPYLKEKAAGHEPWPPIPDDWMTTDQTGKPILTPEASKKLDDYHDKMNDFVEQLKKHPELDVGIGTDDPSLTVSLLHRYLNPPTNAGEKNSPVVLPATDALRQQANVKSTIERLQRHITNWLINPGYSNTASEQVVMKTLNLKDGETIEIPSHWDASTSDGGMLGTRLISDNDSTDGLAALGHVGVSGNAVAKVTRVNGRYFVTVDVENTLHDTYDFGKNNQTPTNLALRHMNLPEVDFEMLALLAETGRAKPFDVQSSWNSQFTAELVPFSDIPPYRFFLRNKHWETK